VKEIVLGFLTSFFVVLVTTPSLIKVAKLKHLVDVPTEARKLHVKRIPTIGGIILFAAILFSFTLWVPVNPFLDSVTLANRGTILKFLTSAMIILFFIGIKDDIIGVSPTKKLIGLGLVGFILVVMADFRITGFSGLLGIYEIPYWASILLSFFVYIVIVNAFNLIDGVDGLAASEGLLIGLLFGVWFYLNGNITIALLAFVLSGAVLGFLFFNFFPAKIFMGDSGSMTIGVVVSLLAIWLIDYDHSGMPFPLNNINSPLIAMTFLAYPLTDTLRIFFIRATKGLSPFAADKNHIHHCLLRNGFHQRQVVYAVLIYNLLMVLTAILTSTINPNLSLIVLAFTDVILVFLMLKIKGKYAPQK